MALLDFKEIPANDKGKGDNFEMFAREFFSEILHFEIESEPNRGADNGKDLIAIEYQTGSLSSTKIRWLISCKHKAHSDQSVSPTEEDNISDRIKEHDADGFIGFYSTLPSSSLNNRFDKYKKQGNKIVIFNSERIETELIKSKNNDLIKRFFPKSFKKISHQKNEPAIIYDSYEPLLCEYCGKDLLKENIDKAICVFIKNINSGEYIDIYTCCSGCCDKTLLATKRPQGCVDSWESISDWTIPLNYTKATISFLNQFYFKKVKYSEAAFEKLKQIILQISQSVLREPTEKQKQRLIELSMLQDI